MKHISLELQKLEERIAPADAAVAVALAQPQERRLEEPRLQS